jgi:hypothetical protein
VVDRTAVGEASLVVEFRHVFGRVGWNVLFIVGEGAAVSEDAEIGKLGLVQPEEFSGAHATEPHRLGLTVFAMHSMVANDPARDEDAVVGRVTHDLMRKGIGALRSSRKSYPGSTWSMLSA